MRPQRLFVAVLTAFVVAVPVRLTAQKPGAVELGGFGQWTKVDGAWRMDNGIGGGGRLGVFLSSRLQLETDFGTSTFTNHSPPRPAGTSTNQTFTGQINFNLPFEMGGRTHQFLIEAGAGGQRFDGHTDFTAPLGGGFRFNLSDLVALRLDGIVQYVENPTATTFLFPPAPGVNEKAARSTNVELRAGLSFVFGNSKPAPPPPPAVVAVQQQARQDTPAPQPTQPPPAPDRSAIVRDSLAAVAKAREALAAPVMFDFDRSELRADQRARLDAKLPILRANPKVRIRIEGNADERGSDEYNMALGMRRAQESRKYLVEHGIDAGRIDISSNGEERPVCLEENEGCWVQNRRDEFVIIAGDTLVAPQ